MKGKSVIIQLQPEEYEQSNLQDDAISQDGNAAYTFDNSLHQAFGPLNSLLSEQEDPLPSLPLFHDVIPPPLPLRGLGSVYC